MYVIGKVATKKLKLEMKNSFTITVIQKVKQG